MAKYHGLTLFFLSLVISTAVCQTFQYSRGWTNGKRSVSAPVEELVNFMSKTGGQYENNAVVNCELQKLKQIMQGNYNDQLLHLPCDVFSASKKSFPDVFTVPHFR